MKKEEFRESKLVKGKLVNVGVDEYGQQFFIEYEQDGKLQEVGCGCYVTDYDTFIESWFCEPEPFYAHLDERLKNKFKIICEMNGTTIEEALNKFMKVSIDEQKLNYQSNLSTTIPNNADANDEKITVNKAIKKIMKEKGMTQEHMAKLLGNPTGQRYVGNILRGENMNMNIVIAFCNLLDYEVVLKPQKRGKREDGEYTLCKGELYTRRGEKRYIKKSERKDED